MWDDWDWVGLGGWERCVAAREGWEGGRVRVRVRGFVSRVKDPSSK